MSASKTPRNLMLRGSLITLRRRCGRPSCRCAGKDGQPQESPALSCTIGGKSHIITLSSEEVKVVSEALDRNRQEQVRLEDACVAGIAWLRKRVDARRVPRQKMSAKDV